MFQVCTLNLTRKCVSPPVHDNRNVHTRQSKRVRYIIQVHCTRVTQYFYIIHVQGTYRYVAKVPCPTQRLQALVAHYIIQVPYILMHKYICRERERMIKRIRSRVKRHCWRMIYTSIYNIIYYIIRNSHAPRNTYTCRRRSCDAYRYIIIIHQRKNMQVHR